MWTGAATDLEAVRRVFPGVVTQCGVLATRGIPACGLENVAAAVDAPLLEGLARHEFIALAMMDRMDATGSAFGHDERRRHFLDLVSHWDGVLAQTSPDVVVFSISPHVVYDYVLYALCVSRGIPTLMFERTGAPGHLFVQSQFEAGSARLSAAYRRQLGAETHTLPNDLADYLERQRGSARGAAPNFARKIEKFGLHRTGVSQAIAETSREARRFAYLVLRRGSAPDNYLKSAGRDVRQEPSLLEWQYIKLAGMRQKRRLRRLVDRLATEPGDEPFVLVLLHFQPERATLPSAGVLFDQTLMVDLIARTLPSGWTIVVKEHPWQLSYYSRGEFARSEDFYRRLVRNPAVRLVPTDASTDQLLVRANAVATMTGSVGWQAVCRGIPALVFGAAWYRDVNGVHSVRSADDLRSAFNRILAGAKPDVRAPAALLAAIAEIGVKGMLEPSVEDVGDLDAEVAAANMATALADAWRTRNE